MKSTATAQHRCHAPCPHGAVAPPSAPVTRNTTPVENATTTPTNHPHAPRENCNPTLRPSVSDASNATPTSTSDARDMTMRAPSTYHVHTPTAAHAATSPTPNTAAPRDVVAPGDARSSKYPTTKNANQWIDAASNHPHVVRSVPCSSMLPGPIHTATSPNAIDSADGPLIGFAGRAPERPATSSLRKISSPATTNPRSVQKQIGCCTGAPTGGSPYSAHDAGGPSNPTVAATAK